MIIVQTNTLLWPYSKGFFLFNQLKTSAKFFSLVVLFRVSKNTESCYICLLLRRLFVCCWLFSWTSMLMFVSSRQRTNCLLFRYHDMDILLEIFKIQYVLFLCTLFGFLNSWLGQLDRSVRFFNTSFCLGREIKIQNFFILVED